MLRVLVPMLLTVLTVRWVLRVLVLKMLTVLVPTVLKVPVLGAQEVLLAVRHPRHVQHTWHQHRQHLQHQHR